MRKQTPNHDIPKGIGRDICSKEMVAKMRSGHRRPSIKLAMRIHRECGVPLTSVYRPDDEVMEFCRQVCRELGH